MSEKNDKIKESKYGRIVWAQSTFTADYLVGLGFRLGLVIFFMIIFFPMFIVGILLSPNMLGIIMSNIFGFIVLTLISVALVWMFITLLFSKSIFSIKFTESHLRIKRRILGIPKRFDISSITQIEVTFLKEKAWFKIRRGRGWHAQLNFAFKIATTDYKEKKYSFIHVFYAPKRASWGQTMQKAFETRTDFEKELSSLAVLFPKIIKFDKETHLPRKK